MTKKLKKMWLCIFASTILIAPLALTISCASSSQEQENLPPNNQEDNSSGNNSSGNSGNNGNNGNNENNGNSGNSENNDNSSSQNKLDFWKVDPTEASGTLDDNFAWTNGPFVFMNVFKNSPLGLKADQIPVRISDENDNPITYRITISKLIIPSLNLSQKYPDGTRKKTIPLNFTDSSGSLFFDVSFKIDNKNDMVVFANDKNINGSTTSWWGYRKVLNYSSGVFLDKFNDKINCNWAIYYDGRLILDPFINNVDSEPIDPLYSLDWSPDQPNKNETFSFEYSIAPLKK